MENFADIVADVVDVGDADKTRNATVGVKHSDETDDLNSRHHSRRNSGDDIIDSIREVIQGDLQRWLDKLRKEMAQEVAARAAECQRTNHIGTESILHRLEELEESMMALDRRAQEQREQAQRGVRDKMEEDEAQRRSVKEAVKTQDPLHMVNNEEHENEAQVIKEKNKRHDEQFHKRLGDCSEIFSLVLILADAVLYTVATQIGIEDAIHGDLRFVKIFHTIDLCFTLAFTFDICFKVYHQGFYGYLHGDRKWFNFLDALTLIVDICAKLFETQIPRVGRFFRLIRWMRTLTLLRFSTNVKTLRLFVVAMMDCIPFMCWAALVLLALLYVGSVLIMNETRSYLEDHSVTSEGAVQLIDQYGTFGRAMYTLFQASHNMIMWDDVTGPLEAVGASGTVSLMVGWKYLTSFAMLVSVSTATVAFIAQDMPRLQREEQKLQADHKGSPINVFKTLLEQNARCPHTITKHELVEALKDERMQPVLEGDLNLEIDTVLIIFDDCNTGGEVRIEDFVRMLLKSFDSVTVMSLMNETRRLAAMLLIIQQQGGAQ